MSRTLRTRRHAPMGKRLLFVLLTFLLMISVLPNIAWADPPVPATPGGEVCTLCHWNEISRWRNSAHAANGVVCEDCHGEYKAGHPEQGVMVLSVSPDQCRQCHEISYRQWQGSLHSQDNVTCISCHTPHNQTTRLESQQLCLSCHDENVGKSWEQTAHAKAGVSCADCHLSQPSIDQTSPEVGASGHGFTKIPSQVCSNCHAKNLHAPATIIRGKISLTGGHLASITAQDREMSARLDAAEKKNDTLQTWVLVMLGLGLGIGIAVGVITTLILFCAKDVREVAS